MNTNMKFSVTGQRIELTEPVMLVAGTMNIYTASFAFDAAWEGYTKTAVFRGGDVERERLLTDDVCTVPWEVLVAGKYLRVGVYGTKDDIRLPTIWAERTQYINSGASPTEEAAEPSPTLVEQLLTKVGNLDALKTEDKSSVVAAINEVWASGGGGSGASVTDAAINEDGHLIITLSTGKQIDAGYAVGPAGADGQDGANGKSAYQYAKDGGYTGTEADFAAKMEIPAVDTTLTESGKAADAAAVGARLSSLSEEKVSLPKDDTGATQNGTDGQILQTNGDGTTQWVDKPTGGSSEENPTVATVEPAVEDIPKVFFGGGVQQTKDEVTVPFRYISKTLDFSCYAKIKAQGDSSMLYPKKNQTIKLYKDAACTEKQKVDFRGWGKQSKFVLKANWIDLSHARNLVSARIWGDVVKSRAEYTALSELLRTSPNQGAVDGFPIKLYANGVYQGRYTLNIPKDAWMANMYNELDEHCILCSENYKSSCFREAAVINGDDWSDEVHDTVPDSIKTRWNEVISFVMNSTDEEFKNNLKNYLYVDSLIDYYIFGLVACDLDGYGKNQVYFTYDGVRWFASLYDKDSTWGLYWNGGRFVPYNYSRDEYEDFVNGQGNLLYIRLAALFSDEIKARYNELKSGAMSIPNIINHFERFMDVCPLDLVKEDYASTTGDGAFTAIPSQSTNNIQQIRDYLVNRYQYVDTLLNPVLCTGITLSASELTFTAVGKQTITATLIPADTTEVLTWESSNESVATVSDGEITVVGDGEAVITARCGTQSATCNVSASGTSGGAMYPLADGRKTFTEGITLEITNGNHVKVSATKWVQGVYLNLSNINANTDSAASEDNIAFYETWFALPAGTAVFAKKNTTFTNATSFNANCTFTKEDGSKFALYNAQKFNLDASKDHTIAAPVNIGSLNLYIQGIDANDTVEFDVELLVNGAQYI